MTTFYAQPYSLDHTGFYFESLEEFETGMETLNKRGCEEVELQFIDGESHHAALAKAAEMNQANITLWFETLDDLDEQDATRLTFLLERGFRLEDALDRYEEVCLYKGRPSDYAQELIEETTQIPENLRYYIDYDAIARDMRLNGEIEEIDGDTLVTNAYDF